MTVPQIEWLSSPLGKAFSFADRVRIGPVPVIAQLFAVADMTGNLNLHATGSLRELLCGRAFLSPDFRISKLDGGHDVVIYGRSTSIKLLDSPFIPDGVLLAHEHSDVEVIKGGLIPQTGATDAEVSLPVARPKFMVLRNPSHHYAWVVQPTEPGPAVIWGSPKGASAPPPSSGNQFRDAMLNNRGIHTNS